MPAPLLDRKRALQEIQLLNLQAQDLGDPRPGRDAGLMLARANLSVRHRGQGSYFTRCRAGFPAASSYNDGTARPPKVPPQPVDCGPITRR
jgi:hypothetical protein